MASSPTGEEAGAVQSQYKCYQSDTGAEKVDCLLARMRHGPELSPTGRGQVRFTGLSLLPMPAPSPPSRSSSALSTERYSCRSWCPQACHPLSVSRTLSTVLVPGWHSECLLNERR